MNTNTIHQMASDLAKNAQGIACCSGQQKNIVILTDFNDMQQAQNSLKENGYRLVRMSEHAQQLGQTIREIFDDIWRKGRYLVLLSSFDAHGSILVCETKDLK